MAGWLRKLKGALFVKQESEPNTPAESPPATAIDTSSGEPPAPLTGEHARQFFGAMLEYTARITVPMQCTNCGGSTEVPIVGLTDQNPLECHCCGKVALANLVGVAGARALIRRALDLTYDRVGLPLRSDLIVDHFQKTGTLRVGDETFGPVPDARAQFMEIRLSMPGDARPDEAEPEWRHQIARNDRIAAVKAAVEETKSIERTAPDAAIEKYRALNSEIVACEDEYDQKVGSHKQQGWGEQGPLRRLAMLLRRQKRYAELIEDVERFYDRFPNCASNQNDLQRWRAEAREKLGLPPPKGYQLVMPKPSKRKPSTYNVGLVGESFYQRTIERCREGDPVVLFREAGNPYDPRAIVCVTADGDPIGYIARDHFLQRAVHGEKQGCEAEIGSIRGSPGKLGVVILASLCDEPLGERRFVRT